MVSKKSWLPFFRGDQGGVVAEYAILISGIAAVVLATVYLIGLTVYIFYNNFWESFH